MFIDEKCENVKVVIDGGESTKNINQKKRQAFYKPIDLQSLANTADDGISSIGK